MPIINSDDNRQYDFYVGDTECTIQILRAHPKPYYYRAIVDNETVENYADSEGEAYRKAFEGIDWLLDNGE